MAEARRQSRERQAADSAWMQYCAEVLRVLPDGLLVLDSSGRVVYANTASERIFGAPEAQLMGRRYDDAVLFGMTRIPEEVCADVAPSPAHDPGVGQPVERALESGEPARAVHFTLERADVARKHLSLDVIPLIAEWGGVVGTSLIIRDETDGVSARYENEWLHNDLVRARREAEDLLRLSESLGAINDVIHSTLDFDEVLQRVLREAARSVGAESGVVEMLTDDVWVPRVVLGLTARVIGRRLTPEQSPHASIVAETRETLVADLALDKRLTDDFLRSLGRRQVIAVPLLARGDVVGVLSLHRSSASRFSYAEMDFAARVATTMSLAMENARVYAEERHIADTLQRALIAVPSSVRGVEFEYVYRSATEAAWVGGDFFDIFELPGNRVGIIIGDVAGKGVEASVLASFTRQLLKAYASEDSPLAAAMARANDLVRSVSRHEDFVTVFLGILSLDDGVLDFCSAGHPPPVLRHEGRGRFIQDGGPLLGAFFGVDYHDRQERVEPGDLIVLYTDGVIEARRDGELFGDARLMDLVESLPEATVRGMPDEMVARVSEFAEEHLRDDVAILCVRRLSDGQA